MHVFWVMLVGGGELAIFFHEKLHSDYFHHFNSAPKLASVFFLLFWHNYYKSSFFCVTINNQWQTALTVIVKLMYHTIESTYSTMVVLSVAPSGANWIGV